MPAFFADYYRFGQLTKTIVIRKIMVIDGGGVLRWENLQDEILMKKMQGIGRHDLCSEAGRGYLQRCFLKCGT